MRNSLIIHEQNTKEIIAVKDRFLKLTLMHIHM